MSGYAEGWEHGYRDGLDAAAAIAEDPHPEGASRRIAERIRAALARHIEDVGHERGSSET